MIHAWWDRSFHHGWKVVIKMDKYMTQPPEPGDCVLVSRKDGVTKMVKLGKLLYHHLPSRGLEERWEFKLATYEGAEDGVTAEWEAWAKYFTTGAEAGEEAGRRSEEVGGGEGRAVC